MRELVCEHVTTGGRAGIDRVREIDVVPDRDTGSAVGRSERIGGFVGMDTDVIEREAESGCE
ncbi:MAG TPA: hypothetical protein VGM88_09195 [Kofleriaceae bacterium]